MTDSDWDFFIPGETMPLNEWEKAAEKVSEVFEKTPVQCVQVHVDGDLVELSLSLAVQGGEPETLMATIARAMLRTATELLRADGYADGVAQGKHLASLKRTA